MRVRETEGRLNIKLTTQNINHNKMENTFDHWEKALTIFKNKDNVYKFKRTTIKGRKGHDPKRC